MTDLLRFVDAHFDALLALVGVLAVPFVVWRLGRHTTRKAEEALDVRVGSPNGMGNVIQMLERTLENDGYLYAKVDELGKKIEEHVKDPAAHG